MVTILPKYSPRTYIAVTGFLRKWVMSPLLCQLLSYIKYTNTYIKSTHHKSLFWKFFTCMCNFWTLKQIRSHLFWSSDCGKNIKDAFQLVRVRKDENCNFHLHFMCSVFCVHMDVWMYIMIAMFFNYITVALTWANIFLCSPGWPGMPYVDQAGLELREICLAMQNTRISHLLPYLTIYFLCL